MSYYGAAVEYGLHTLLNLSQVPKDVSASARDLAEFQRLPVPFVRKLLTQLAAAGLVVGAEGVRGGWRLARTADRITLLAAAEAVQPGSALFKCREIRAHCALWHDDDVPKSALSGVCSIHAAMLAAEAAMRRELAARTLADIAVEVAGKTGGGDGKLPDWFRERYDKRRRPTGENGHD